VLPSHLVELAPVVRIARALGPSRGEVVQRIRRIVRDEDEARSTPVGEEIAPLVRALGGRKPGQGCVRHDAPVRSAPRFDLHATDRERIVFRGRPDPHTAENFCALPMCGQA